jgi:hypothetical protein
MFNLLKPADTRRRQRLSRGCVLLAVCLDGSTASAQRRARFEQDPFARPQAVQKALNQAATKKAEARAWAKARGLKVRRRVNGRVIELMEIRNGRPYYYTTHNDEAAVSAATDLVRDFSPYNLDGSGQTVGVWDGDEIYTAHQEFSGGRVTIYDSTPDPHWHATHVAGTIGASGVQSSAKGMAPAVLLDSYDWNSDIGEMTDRAASYPGEPGKIYLSNHSYGFIVGWDREGGEYYWYGNGWNASAEARDFGRYDSWARQTDEIVHNAPYFLPFKSAGNDRTDNPSVGDTVHLGEGGAAEIYSTSSHPAGDGNYKSGYDTISLIGNAKNIMTVGAVTDAVSGGARSLSGVTTTAFSCWGPADDGRIKPDIVANGWGLYSCDNGHSSDYRIASGTSMSSPNACGSAALLVQYYSNLVSGAVMRASTLKGLIIHTADDLGRPGPDYEFGWGLMNTRAAAELLSADAGSSPIRMTEAMLHSSTNTSDTYTIFSGGVHPIRATLCWTDPPGSAVNSHDSRSARLVNDLDLKITGPGGTYYPYKLSYSNPSANATANSENNVDNVEQVYIAAPVIGEYTITVDYDTLSGAAQWYSLLVDGDSVDSDGDVMPDYWEAQYFGSTTGAIATSDSDGDAANNLTEYISGYDPTNPGSVFQITSFSVPVSNGTPFIVNWNTMPGRLYSVGHSSNLMFDDFSAITNAVDLPHTQSSYTDTVDRAGAQNFYRVDVRLDQ